MGQKINPLGFRLGATQGHHSLWFSQPKNYSEDLQEDQKIRNYGRTTGIEPARGGFTIHCLDPLGYIRPYPRTG